MLMILKMVLMGRIRYQIRLIIGERISKYITFVTRPSPLRGFDGLRRFRIAYRNTVLILKDMIVLYIKCLSLSVLVLCL